MNGSDAFSWGLLLLCALHACAAGGKTGERNGSCPQPPSYPKCEDLKDKPKDGCSTDQQCPEEEKCCYYGCSLQCKKPLKEKLGSCQDFDRAKCMFVRPLPNECESDSQCPGNTKCCCRNCRKACSETVKSGICPPIEAKCVVPLPEPKCKNDSICPGRQKCCSLCGDQCMDPEPENPGICPVDPEIENQCGFLPPPLCSRDAECASNEKCCRFGCGVQCVKALAAKPGVCPNILAKCKVPLDAPRCQSDSDCLSNKKCCKLCGNKCLDPEPDHDGFCPAPKPVRCDAKYISDCSRDSGCKDDEKCCDTGCKIACVKSAKEKTGVCPFIAIDESAEGMCNKCNNDSDCPGKEKCCAGAKGRECQDPPPENVIVKPGECPPLISWCDYPPPYLHQCDHDGNCTGGQKCCIQVCTRECRDAVPEKPGVCPKPDIICEMFPLRRNCSNDSECPGLKKCCTLSCSIGCTDPNPEKCGVCPAPATSCAAVDRPATKPKCTSDRDCLGSQKCCIPFCTRECTDAIVPVKTGECPKDTIVCKRTEPDRCEKDCDCPGNERCCYFACGKKCKAPETAHPGSCPIYKYKIGIVCLKNMTKVECNDDSVCASDEKCCSVPVCTTKCVKAVPVTPKPGTCPADTIRCIRKEEDLCKIDSDCKEDKKCCYNRCGLKCVAAVKEKPGECPVPATTCIAVSPPPVPKCTQDSDCQGSQKCCTPFCIRECTDVIEQVKPGQCPIPITKCATPLPPPRCQKDSECPGTEKCCTPVCTQQCTKIVPVTEKNGSCPLPPSYPTCDIFPTKPKDQCATDQQCPAEEKCCNYGCSLQCKKPVQEKLGSCPDFNRSICRFARPAPAECSSDLQCPGTQRCCCHGACRMQCAETVPVKQGKCPIIMAMCTNPLQPSQCENDGDCTDKKKCCYFCGKKCLSPAENPGFCPVELDKEPQCGNLHPPQCSGDSDCAKNEKCCMFGCGVQCVKALSAKPGMCPAILAKCAPPLPEPKCQTDGDCLANKKCCQLCGKTCLDADPDHAGVCPSYITTLMACPASYTPSCQYDWNCQADEKCCNVGCKRQCVKALKEKMGFCPKKGAYTVSEDYCNKCNNDKDCPGSERCCAGAKGRECIPPLSFTGLPLPTDEPPRIKG